MVSPFAENTHKHTHTKTHACWHAGTDHTSGAIRQPNSVEKRAFSAERTRVRELNWIFNGPKPIESACQRKNTLPPCWPVGDRMLGPVMESNLHFELFFHPSWLVRQPSRGEFFRSFVKHATISHRGKKTSSSSTDANCKLKYSRPSKTRNVLSARINYCPRTLESAQ